MAPRLYISVMDLSIILHITCTTPYTQITLAPHQLEHVQQGQYHSVSHVAKPPPPPPPWICAWRELASLATSCLPITQDIGIFNDKTLSSIPSFHHFTIALCPNSPHPHLPALSLAIRSGFSSIRHMSTLPCPWKAAQWHGVHPVPLLVQFTSALNGRTTWWEQKGNKSTVHVKWLQGEC